MSAAAATKVAFLDHYQPLHERFVRYGHSRAYGPLDTEDLVQEAILHALHIREHAKLLAYLMGNTVNNIIRRQARQGKHTGKTYEQIFTDNESDK